MINWIATTYIPPWFWIALIVHNVIMGTVAYLILLERKIAAAGTQYCVGPNRVGPLGFAPAAGGWVEDVFEGGLPARRARTLSSFRSRLSS